MKNELIYRYNVPADEIRKDKICKKCLKAAIGAVAILMILATILLFSSCEKKDLCYLPHPHDKKICHTALTLNFNTLWGEDIITSTYADGDDGNETEFNTRYILEFWVLGDDGALQTLVEHREVNDGKMLKGDNTYTAEVDLPAARIAVMCWAEPVDEQTRANNPHFDNADLRQVKLQNCGAALDKDAFTASAVWDLTPYIYERDGITLPGKTLTMNRPFGRYRLISNDVKEYYEDKGPEAPLPVSDSIAYQLWIPMTYDVFAQSPTQPVAGKSYVYVPALISEEEMRMAEDVIFVGTADTDDNYFNFTVSSFAQDQSLIHASGNVEARIQRNKTTLIYGAMLTNRQTNSPGIDDSFDDEIIIEIPD